MYSNKTRIHLLPQKSSFSSSPLKLTIFWLAGPNKQNNSKKKKKKLGGKCFRGHSWNAYHNVTQQLLVGRKLIDKDQQKITAFLYMFVVKSNDTTAKLRQHLNCSPVSLSSTQCNLTFGRFLTSPDLWGRTATGETSVTLTLSCDNTRANQLSQ